MPQAPVSASTDCREQRVMISKSGGGGDCVCRGGGGGEVVLINSDDLKYNVTHVVLE